MHTLSICVDASQPCEDDMTTIWYTVAAVSRFGREPVTVSDSVALQSRFRLYRRRYMHSNG